MVWFYTVARQTVAVAVPRIYGVIICFNYEISRSKLTASSVLAPAEATPGAVSRDGGESRRLLQV
jgi:hypothetical protein